MDAGTHALYALVAARAGDRDRAHAHLERARTTGRQAARRDRQLVEIVSLVIAGHHDRAHDLTCEHEAQFPDDGAVLHDLVSGGPGPAEPR